jgi:SrtB family sortase
MNADVGGWVHIPETGVDYPVMQYADGHYRNHNFDKEYSVYGQPYLDEHFSLTHQKMQIIHGRNTGDGQMFSDLLHYRRVAYLQEHPVIEMNTLYGNARWQIFAVCVRDTRDEDRFNLGEEPKDYDDFVDSLLRRSLFLSDLQVTGEDTFLLLTANAQREYGFNGAQLVVAARLITGEAQDTTYRVNNRAQMPAALGGSRTTTRTTRTTRATTTTTTVTTTTTTTTARPTSAETTSTTGETLASTTSTATTTADDIPVQPPQDDNDQNGENDDYIGN